VRANKYPYPRQKTRAKYIHAIKLVKESLDEPERKKMVD
jgi:hypothetical protein